MKNLYSVTYATTIEAEDEESAKSIFQADQIPDGEIEVYLLIKGVEDDDD